MKALLTEDLDIMPQSRSIDPYQLIIRNNLGHGIIIEIFEQADGKVVIDIPLMSQESNYTRRKTLVLNLYESKVDTM